MLAADWWYLIQEQYTANEAAVPSAEQRTVRNVKRRHMREAYRVLSLPLRRQTRTMLTSALRHCSVTLWATYMLRGLAMRACRATQHAYQMKRKVAAFVEEHGTEGQEGAVMELVEQAEDAIGVAQRHQNDAVNAGVPDQDWRIETPLPTAIPSDDQLAEILHEMVRRPRRVNVDV